MANLLQGHLAGSSKRISMKRRIRFSAVYETRLYKLQVCCPPLKYYSAWADERPVGDLYSIHAQIQVETILFSKNADIETDLQDWSLNANNNMYQREVQKTNYLKRTI